MNFLADESVDKPIVEGLRRQNYIVGYVAEMDPGISDDLVLDLANREKALLLTADKDFGELVFRLRRLSSGAQPLPRKSLMLSPWWILPKGSG